MVYIYLLEGAPGRVHVLLDAIPVSFLPVPSPPIESQLEGPRCLSRPYGRLCLHRPQFLIEQAQTARSVFAKAVLIYFCAMLFLVSPREPFIFHDDARNGVVSVLLFREMISTFVFFRHNRIVSSSTRRGNQATCNE